MTIELAELLRLVVQMTIALGAAVLLGRHPSLSVVWVVAGLAIATLTASPAVLGLTAAILLAAGCHWFGRITFRAYFRAVFALGVVTILYAEFAPSGYIAVARQLRVEFPLESLTDRLAYEATGTNRDPPPEISTRLEQGLIELQHAQARPSGDPWYALERSLALQALHTETAAGFAIAQGFGVGRGLRAATETIRLPPVEPVPWECVRPDQGFPIDAVPPDDSRLHRLHWSSAGDFLDQARLGYVRDRDHVAGFQSHALTGVPTFPEAEDQEWRVADLALVSLLRHAEQRVYETDSLPYLQ